jgi:thymidine phosphorylase
MPDELKSQQNVEQLEHTLREMESDLTERYCSIGKQVLEVAEREDKEINQLVDKIIEGKKKLSVLQETIQCPKCFSMNNHDNNYCSSCGEKLLKEN